MEYSQFLVTSYKHQERNALSETYNLLTTLCDYELEVSAMVSPIGGLGFLSINNNSVHFSDENLPNPTELAKKYQYIQRIIPLHEINKTTIDEDLMIERLVTKVNSILGNDDKWRISIKKRHSKRKSRELITKIASQIKKGSVDLQEPDWIIQIEIIQKWIAYGLIKPQYIISLGE